MARKIIFMGTPMFAVPILKSLYQNGYPISHVYTQPPQKSQRGQKINKSPIQGIAETLNLEFRTPNNLKDNKNEFEYFKGIEAGCAGIISGSTNIFAGLVQAAINAPGGQESKEFKNVIEARNFSGAFNLMAAMKAAEAKRSGDESWDRLAPPLRELKKEDKQRLFSGLSKIFA